MMGEQSLSTFPLVDQYLGLRLDTDLSALKPGRTEVVETRLRLLREEAYGYIRVLWWNWHSDGRSVVSVPPDAGEAVAEIFKTVEHSDPLADPALADRLSAPINAAIARAGISEINRVFSDVAFACNGALLRRHRHGDCRRLRDETIPSAHGFGLATHCFPDGIVYGVVEDDMVVSCGFAHPTRVMEDRVADLGVETAQGYRQRGYGKTVVSAVVEHIARTGGEARYVCRPDNEASIATARSVGFIAHGASLVLAAPVPESMG